MFFSHFVLIIIHSPILCCTGTQATWPTLVYCIPGSYWWAPQGKGIYFPLPQVKPQLSLWGFLDPHLLFSRCKSEKSGVMLAQSRRGLGFGGGGYKPINPKWVFSNLTLLFKWCMSKVKGQESYKKRDRIIFLPRSCPLIDPPLSYLAQRAWWDPAVVLRICIVAAFTKL